MRGGTRIIPTPDTDVVDGMVSDLMKVSFYRLATLSVPALDSRPFLEAVGSARILSKQVPPRTMARYRTWD